MNTFSTGAGAPPPARAVADASPRICLSSARHGRRRSFSPRYTFWIGAGLLALSAGWNFGARADTGVAQPPSQGFGEPRRSSPEQPASGGGTFRAADDTHAAALNDVSEPTSRPPPGGG